MSISSQFILLVLVLFDNGCYRWLQSQIINYCFNIISYNGLVYYLTLKWWLRPLALFNRTNIIHMTPSLWRRLNMLCTMYDVQDYIVLCGIVLRSLICKGWHFTHMWKKNLYDCLILTKRRSSCKKPENWAVMCLRGSAIDFASFNALFPHDIAENCSFGVKELSHTPSIIFYWILGLFRQCGIFFFFMLLI